MKILSFAVRTFLFVLALLTVASTAFAQSQDWLASLPSRVTTSKNAPPAMTAPAATPTCAPSRPARPSPCSTKTAPAPSRTSGSPSPTTKPYHLKNIVLRMYWDGETTPSVETPIGDFFGLGLGEYYTYQSAPLAVAPEKGLNSFFPMPFQTTRAHHRHQRRARQRINAFYFNIDYRTYTNPLPADTLYFHAQYHQAPPTHGLDQRLDQKRRRSSAARKNFTATTTTSGWKPRAVATSSA